MRGLVRFVVGLSLLLASACGCPDAYRGSVAFDAAAWRQQASADAPPGVRPTRLQMVRSLHDQGLLRTGMTRTEVEALLGPPDASSWSGRYPYPAWTVGNVESGMICDNDSAAVIIDIGDKDRVQDVHWPPGL